MKPETPKTPKTIQDLRQADTDGITWLRKMSENGGFDDVLAIAARDIKTHLTYDDVMTRDKNGVNILMVMGWQNKLDDLFHPALWKNGHNELAEVVNHMPRIFQKQIDGPAAIQNVIRKQFNYKERVGIKRRPPKP